MICQGISSSQHTQPQHITNESFLLTEITFDSDIPLSKEEFYYLTGLMPNTIINEKHLQKAHQTLLQKNRFKHIAITIQPNKLGKSVHITLIGNWTIKNVKCRGIAFGREQYLNLYSQQPGEVFDATLHEESLLEIKNKLLDEGFFDHKIDDEIVYNPNLKYLSIYIAIGKKSPFITTQVTFNIKNNSSEISNLLEQKLMHQFSWKLLFKKTYQ